MLTTGASLVDSTRGSIMAKRKKKAAKKRKPAKRKKATRRKKK
jgi:hypothetical protein